jgi:enamine deaminase RidA (YjgF/YER057c/UK114 family)
MSKRKTIIPKAMQPMYDQFHFAPAVRVGKHVFCSGQLGNGPDGKIDPDPSVQFSQAFENVQTVLSEAGADMRDIVEITTFHVGLRDHIGVFMQVKDAFIDKEYPAWTAIGVSELAFDGALVEIKARAITKKK